MVLGKMRVVNFMTHDGTKCWEIVVHDTITCALEKRERGTHT